MRILWAYGNNLAVSGDASLMGAIGDTFLIYPPAGISKFDNKINFGDDSPRYLFAGYRYMPVVGGALRTVTEGTYLCWNREYDPVIGRLTTPDPAKSPVWNLYDYVGQRPVGRRDGFGLKMGDEVTLKTVLFELGDCGHFDWRTTWVLSNKAEAPTEAGQELHIIQEIKIHEEFIACRQGAVPKVRDEHYLEAWIFLAGETVSTQYTATKGQIDAFIRKNPGRIRPGIAVEPFDDLWVEPERKGTKGHSFTLATAYLIKNLPLPANFKPSKTEPWGDLPGAHTNAITPIGDLVKNAGNAIASAGNISRSADVSWDCCAATSKSKVDISGVPTDGNGIPTETSGCPWPRVPDPPIPDDWFR